MPEEIPRESGREAFGIMGQVVRTIGTARAKVKIGMANLAYNMRLFVWLSGKYAAERAGGAAYLLM